MERLDTPGPRTGRSLLRRAIIRNWQILLPGSVLIILFQAAAAAIPLFIGKTIDEAIMTGSISGIAMWIGFLGLAFIVLTASYQAGARLLMLALSREAHHLRVELSHRILSPSAGTTDRKSGELLSIATSDADLASAVIDHVPRVLAGVAATAVGGAILLSISPVLGLAVLLGVPAVVAVLHVLAPAVQKRVGAQQHQIGLTSALATDLITGLRPLQGIGVQTAAAERYRASSRSALAAALGASRIRNLQLGLSTVGGAGTAMGVAVFAVFATVEGHIGIGALVTVVGIAQFLIDPLTQLATAPSWFAQARASADRVAAVLDTSGETTAEESTDATPHDSGLEVAVRGHELIPDLMLQVEPGEFVAVATDDGEVAHALVELLADPSSVTSARVGVGGVPVDRIPHGDRRAILLVEHHEGDLFTDPVADNLRIGSRSEPSPADEAPLDEVLAAARADEVISLRADGLTHRLDDRGADLSGGQRQRLRLARALLTTPAVLILHDPTTAVDPVTEQAIASGLRRLRSGTAPPTRYGPATTVIVTISPALLAAADRVVFLRDGRLSGDSTHATLLSSDTDYRELVIR